MLLVLGFIQSFALSSLHLFWLLMYLVCSCSVSNDIIIYCVNNRQLSGVMKHVLHMSRHHMWPMSPSMFLLQNSKVKVYACKQHKRKYKHMITSILIVSLFFLPETELRTERNCEDNDTDELTEWVQKCTRAGFILNSSFFNCCYWVLIVTTVWKQDWI